MQGSVVLLSRNGQHIGREVHGKLDGNGCLVMRIDNGARFVTSPVVSIDETHCPSKRDVVTANGTVYRFQFFGLDSVAVANYWCKRVAAGLLATADLS